jgi:hypothetical protein
MAKQRPHHVQIDPGTDPVGGRGVAQHVRPDWESALARQPVEHALGRPVGHRRTQRLVVEIHQHHLGAVLTHQLGPLVLVVAVAGEHRVADRHRAREP